MTRAPEAQIGIFGFLTAFLWEMWQMPFYQTVDMSLMRTVVGCTLGAAGDAGLMVFGYAMTSWRAGSRLWLSNLKPGLVALYLAVGLVVTIAIEMAAQRLAMGWSYSNSMPVDPIFNAGLVPILMWIIVPSVTLWLARTGASPR